MCLLGSVDVILSEIEQEPKTGLRHGVIEVTIRKVEKR